MTILEAHSSFGNAQNRLVIFVEFRVKKKLANIVVAHFYLTVKRRLKMSENSQVLTTLDCRARTFRLNFIHGRLSSVEEITFDHIS